MDNNISANALAGGILCVIVGVFLLISWIRDRGVLFLGWGVGLLIVAAGVFLQGTFDYSLEIIIAGAALMVASWFLDDRMTAKRYQTGRMNLQDDALRELGTISTHTDQDAVSFEVILKSPGPNDAEVVKVLRHIYIIDQIEAEYLLIGCPRPIKQFLSKAEAEYAKSKLEEAGAEVEIRQM